MVYKRVRDMDYTRPEVIMHVKDGGQLFVPDPEAADSPNYDKRERPKSQQQIQVKTR